MASRTAPPDRKAPPRPLQRPEDAPPPPSVTSPRSQPSSPTTQSSQTSISSPQIPSHPGPQLSKPLPSSQPIRPSPVNPIKVSQASPTKTPLTGGEDPPPPPPEEEEDSSVDTLKVISITPEGQSPRPVDFTPRRPHPFTFESKSVLPITPLPIHTVVPTTEPDKLQPPPEKVHVVSRSLNVEGQFGPGAQIFHALTPDSRGHVMLDPGVHYYVRSAHLSEEAVMAEFKAMGIAEIIRELDIHLKPADLPFTELSDFSAVIDRLTPSKRAQFRKWHAHAKQTSHWTLVTAEADSHEKEAQYFYDQAIVYQQASNLMAAVTLFEQAVAACPTMIQAQFNLAKCLDKLRQYTSAAARYLQVVKLDDNYAEAHLGLGLLYLNHLERPLQDVLACMKAALQHADKLSPESHNQALLTQIQTFCALSMWDEATGALLALKERGSTVPPAVITAATQQVQGKLTVPTAGSPTAVKRNSLPMVRSLDLTGYEDDSLHSIFFKMASASPSNLICRNLLKLSLKMADVTSDSLMADAIRMQNLHDELSAQGDTWACSCAHSNVRLSLTMGSLGNACVMLAAKSFLYCGGKGVLLKIWNRCLKRATSRRPSMLPPPSPDVSPHSESKRAPMSSKIKRTSISVPKLDVDGVSDDEMIPIPVREALLDLLIQAWVLRLLWRFGEMSRTDCLTKCSGQLANQTFLVTLQSVELVLDAKGKKKARYDVAIDTKFKKWRVGKRYKEIQEFAQNLTQAMKHSKVFKLVPLPAHTFKQNSTSAKSKGVVAAFFEDFTNPTKYQQFLSEASPAALAIVDAFFSLNANQYYQMLSRTVFAECVLNAVKLCSETESQLSPGLLSVFFEIMVNETVDARMPISEDNLPRLRQELMPTVEVGWKTTTLFHTRNSIISEPFVIPLIFDLFRCMPVGAVNGGLEYLTMLLVRCTSNCALFYPSLTPGTMSSSGWKSWLCYFIPKCFAWKMMDDSKSSNEDMTRDYQHSSQLSLNITIMSVNHAFLTSMIPAADPFSFASVLVAIIKTVMSYRLGDIENPAPVVMEQPDKAALMSSLTADTDDTSASILRALLEGLLHKTISTVNKFRNDHAHPGWTNVFQFLGVLQRLILCNPDDFPSSRSRSTSETQGTPQPKGFPKSQSSLGTMSPRKHSRQLTDTSLSKIKDAWKDDSYLTVDPAGSRLIPQPTLQLIFELLNSLKLDEIDSCTTFGMQPLEVAQVQAHKKQGLQFVEFFTKIASMTPMEDSESDEEDTDSKTDSFVEESRNQTAKERALEFLETGGDLTFCVQRAENLSAQETFIQIKHGKKSYKTKVVKKMESPSFYERFVIPIKPAAQREDSLLRIRACENGIQKKVLAEILLPLSYLEPYAEKAGSLSRGNGPTTPVSAWLNFQDKNSSASAGAAGKKCRLRYVLFFGPDHSPWGTSEVPEEE